MTACPGSSSIPIVAVQVVDRSGADQGRAPKLDKKLIEEEARKAAASWRGFKLRDAKDEEVGWQLTVEIQLTGEREAQGIDGGAANPDYRHRAVGVTMALSALRTSVKMQKATTRFDAEALVAKDVPKAEPFDPLARDAVHRAGRTIAAAIELAEAKDEAIIAALKSDDRGMRERAIAMAGERKMRAAAPTLMEFVKNDEEEQDIVLKSIGALVAIGDERAVSTLIDAGRRRSSAYLGQILFAVAQLGGKEAEAYLFTVQNGHADPEVRENARVAFEELQRRKEAAASKKKE